MSDQPMFDMQRIKEALSKLHQETEAQDLTLGAIQYVPAKDQFWSSLSDGQTDVPVFFNREWVEKYIGTDGRSGEDEIMNEFQIMSQRFTEKLRRSQLKKRPL